MTKVKEVPGLLWIDDGEDMRAVQAQVTVRVTKDTHGATMSMSIDDMWLMMSAPMEPLEDMVAA